VFIVSLIAFVGILAIPLQKKGAKSSVLFLVALAAGALLGDAFLHLLPETVEKFGLSVDISLYILVGILVFFIIERYVHWRHCHDEDCEGHPSSLATMNILGDSLHNFLDGLIIAGSYLVSIPLGIATTIAVVAHEIPQEIGDFGVLLHSGYTRSKALMVNFATALTAVLGAVLALLLFDYTGEVAKFLLPFTIGGFIYIAGSDLIPELHKENDIKNTILTLSGFILGLAAMYVLLFIG
jgi:zinc and cadmium transporter